MSVLCSIFALYKLTPFTVPPPNVTISPSGPIQGAMVGRPQMIQCTVSTVSGVESSSVMISWMGPGGNVTNNSRVTINPTTVNDSDFISILYFMYLMEGDEGSYTCSVTILETNEEQSVMLGMLTGTVYMYIHILDQVCAPHRLVAKKNRVFTHPHEIKGYMFNKVIFLKVNASSLQLSHSFLTIACF